MTQAEAEMYALEVRFKEFEKVLVAVGYSTEEAAQIAAEGWARAKAEITGAAERQGLDIQARFAELTGDEILARDVLHQKRLIELEAIDKTHHALMWMVWGLEDAAEAARKVEDAERARIDLLNQSLGMQLRIAQLIEDEGEARRVTAQLRKLELDQLDESLRPLQRRIWALEDEAKATWEAEEAHQRYLDGKRDELAMYQGMLADVNSFVSTMAGIMSQMYQAVGDRESAKWLRRAGEYMDAGPEVQAMLKELYKLQDESGDNNEIANAIESLRSGIDSLRRSLTQTFAPDRQYRELAQVFTRTLSAAMGGDMDAIGKLVGVTRDYIDASRTYHTDAIAFERDSQKAIIANQKVADSLEGQLTESQQQLQELRNLNSAIALLVQYQEEGAQSIAQMSYQALLDVIAELEKVVSSTGDISVDVSDIKEDGLTLGIDTTGLSADAMAFVDALGRMAESHGWGDMITMSFMATLSDDDLTGDLWRVIKEMMTESGAEGTIQGTIRALYDKNFGFIDQQTFTDLVEGSGFSTSIQANMLAAWQNNSWGMSRSHFVDILDNNAISGSIRANVLGMYDAAASNLSMDEMKAFLEGHDVPSTLINKIIGEMQVKMDVELNKQWLDSLMHRQVLLLESLVGLAWQNDAYTSTSSQAKAYQAFSPLHRMLNEGVGETSIAMPDGVFSSASISERNWQNQQHERQTTALERMRSVVDTWSSGGGDVRVHIRNMPNGVFGSADNGERNWQNSMLEKTVLNLRANNQKIGANYFADGGIATGPMSGYPATLHGTEAIVPLPDGNSIPVDIRGADSPELIAEIKALRQELQSANYQIAKNTRDTAKVLRRIDDGDAITVRTTT